jgi:hypothetical protein
MKAILCLALVSVGCVSTLEEQTRKFLDPPPHNICADGWPLRLIEHPECPHGLCGFTCAPDRWRGTRRGTERILPLSGTP